jgi:hypothetical protein
VDAIYPNLKRQWWALLLTAGPGREPSREIKRFTGPLRLVFRTQIPTTQNLTLPVWRQPCGPARRCG